MTNNLPLIPWNKGKKGLQIAWNKGKGCEQFRGPNSGTWKGGITYHTSGYRYIKNLDHPFGNSQGYVLEHRLVYEKYYNCILLPWIHIHHKNGIKTDNRIENLEVYTNSKHQRVHRIGVPLSEQNKRNLSLHHNRNSNKIGRGPYKQRSDTGKKRPAEIFQKMVETKRRNKLAADKIIPS